MKKIIYSLMIGLALLSAVPQSAHADVQLASMSLNEGNGNMFLGVMADEPWIVWKSGDGGVTWVKASHPQKATVTEWTDTGNDCYRYQYLVLPKKMTPADL